MMGLSICRPALLRWLAALLLSCFALAAQAHKPSDSYLSLRQEGNRVEGQWDIALRDLDYAIGLDHDGDGALTWDEVRQQHAAIAAYALGRLKLGTSKGACSVTAGEQLLDRHTDGTYSVLRFSATCPDKGGALSIDYFLFADLDPQHKGLVKLEGEGQTVTAIMEPARSHQTLVLAAPDRLAQFGAYVREGVWHIWIGYDHILFLLSLLLPAVLLPAPADKLRGACLDVFRVVTAFTLAHSITLALASLSLLSLPSRIVEPAIAVSVILAALNNIVPLFPGRRAVAAFGFGLIHGFGFASVLIDLGLPKGALASSLLGFNLGVELGQLAIVMLFMPVAYALRTTLAYRRMVTGGSAAIALVAAFWLAERL